MTGWFVPLLQRLHFYAALFVGPFILVAAVSGAAYALSPQLERVVYAEQLTAPDTGTTLPLADQISAANAFTGGTETITAVRPAPEPGTTTRVMYAQDGLGESESRAIFVDPATAQIRGDLTVYGTSGVLPIRTWIDQAHRNLHLGELGRLYSETAASWLGVIVLAGAGLWAARFRKARRRARREMLRPSLAAAPGYRRVFSWHTATGVWVLLGALFLSATGITWSQYGGASVSNIRSALDWGTPSLVTTLGDPADAPADEHAHHHGSPAPSGDAPAANPATFDAVRSIGQEVNITTGLVEIRPPAEPGTAWVVQEIQRSYPTEVDGVAVNGQTMQVSDRVDFADFSVPAKLSRWGIDIHMGVMFGLANQLLLAAVALGIAAMVVWGYRMWWLRRPSQPATRLSGGKPPRRGVLARAPWWGVGLVTIVAAGIGVLLPTVGVTLLAFLAVDVILGWRSRHRLEGTS